MSNSKGLVLCVLYADPSQGYPPKRVRDDIPKIAGYADGTTTPTPKDLDFRPGDLVGCKSGELGLRRVVEAAGYDFHVTTDKDGEGCEFERLLPRAVVVISQPFWPAYMTTERFAMAPNLRLCITAGIGSDHVNLAEAMKRNVTVAEVTFSNSISVAEHVIMSVLNLVRNFVPSHEIARAGTWQISDCAKRSYDVEGMHFGTIAAGRIGLAVLRRMKPFDVVLHYYDKRRLPEAVEKELGLTYHSSVENLVKAVDILSIHCPLHPETEHLFDDKLIAQMKRGSYIVNTARGKICDRDAIARALESGQLAGYAGDVWYPQPPPKDHPWRTMPNEAMTPHISGTSLSAQARYAAGTREIFECFVEGRPMRDEYLIVHDGHLAGVGSKSYTPGDATKGSGEASRFGK